MQFAPHSTWQTDILWTPAALGSFDILLSDCVQYIFRLLCPSPTGHLFTSHFRLTTPAQISKSPPILDLDQRQDARTMSAPRTLRQRLPALRAAPKLHSSPIALFCSRASAASSPAASAQNPRSALRPLSAVLRPQFRAFSASPAARHGHVDPPKPGEG